MTKKAQRFTKSTKDAKQHSNRLSALEQTVAENRDIALETHLSLQKAAMAVNRTEMFVFGLVKYLKDEGSVDLQRLNAYMSMLMKSDDLASFWDASVDDFIAGGEDEEQVEGFSALEDLAKKLEDDHVAAMKEAGVEFDDYEELEDDTPDEE